MNLVVLISGRGTNLEAIIRGINSKKIKGKISLVISNKKDAKGLKIAEKYGIKTEFIDPSLYKTREEYDLKLAERIKKENPDLVVLAGYMRILTDGFIDTFENRIINIHPSLIPAFQGLKAQKQALEFGAKFTGCTVHFVTKELDSGPIIVQAVVPVMPDDSEETLSERILHYEHRIYPQAIKWLSDGRVQVKNRHVIVKGAKYGGLPVNPELEDF
ncbi:MAG TPA: phosphoribosylglycinamide formyltransferase [Persephonella sp.]|uniref:Phosphoribosylglycinamide formyltransferase n=1 Tax=Persephonella marina (strain DSM 14350 / EX-H1) TaxID=123214 RepID=C0QSZ3_PERMH|nr:MULTISPECIES: phosphoribosylglycinamide formyltransferase [Persephonella]ACO03637.1 phosphoribosylglycinamide formyltransferase [Persephonella marina EX-H1]HCB70573.1 phosphoribosylglycinamide formyltransferase [Persephonella sp.]